MGQRCRCCTHPDRVALDTAILRGASNAAIARRFGVSDDSVKYHTVHHLGPDLQEAARMWNIEQLAVRLQDLDGHAEAVLQSAKETGNDRLRLSGVEVAGRNIERIFRLSIGHELEERLAQVEQSLLDSQERGGQQ